jgi:hypothetical protein
MKPNGVPGSFSNPHAEAQASSVEKAPWSGRGGADQGRRQALLQNDLVETFIKPLHEGTEGLFASKFASYSTYTLAS